MRPHIVSALFRKEMLDVLRDRRTIMIMVLLPIVLYPLFGILASQARMAQQSQIKKTKYSIGVLQGPLPHKLQEHILKSDYLVAITHPERWRQDLQRGQFALVVEISTKPQITHKKKSASRPTTQTTRPATPTTTSSQQQTGAHPNLFLTLHYASTKESSYAVLKRFKKAMRDYSKLAVKARLQRIGLTESIVHPIKAKQKDIVKDDSRGRFFLAKLFPLLMILMTVMGAFYPAIDLTAGEKERGTLETLLTAPVTPLEIVAGKYMTVTCIAMVTGALNLLSLWFTFSHGIRLAGRETSLSLGLNGFHMLAIFGYLFLIAALSSAIMMSIAAFARSFKEGQNYVTPAYLLCLVPTMMATLPGSKPSLINSFIPIVNIAFSIKGTLEGTIHASYVLNTIISMGIFITGTLMFASKLFAHEQVLFREGDVSILGMFSVKEGLKRQTPTMTEAWTLLSIAFLLLFYVGTTAQKASPAWGLAITLWGCILLPSLLMAKMRKLNMKETFRFKAFSVWMIPGIILLMLGAAPLVSALSEFIASTTMPGWKQFLQEAQKSFSIKNFGISLPLFYILIAVSPGICEEILFRGFLQTTFEKYMKPWTAILLAAFLFGAFHLSIYRLIPTTILGVIMGWLCYRSGSIFPAMLAHMLNNAFSITLSTLVERKIITQAQLEQMPWWFLILAGISMITGMFIVLKTSTPQKDQKDPLQPPQ